MWCSPARRRQWARDHPRRQPPCHWPRPVPSPHPWPGRQPWSRPCHYHHGPTPASNDKWHTPQEGGPGGEAEGRAGRLWGRAGPKVSGKRAELAERRGCEAWPGCAQGFSCQAGCICGGCCEGWRLRGDRDTTQLPGVTTARDPGPRDVERHVCLAKTASSCTSSCCTSSCCTSSCCICCGSRCTSSSRRSRVGPAARARATCGPPSPPLA